MRISGGQHVFAIVGLPDKAVAESRERVRNALHAVGLGLPFKHITVNLAPADLPKEGSHFDLPIALAMMVAMGAISPDAIEGYAAIGELALDASIRGVPGALPAAIGANAMGKGLICPGACGPEAAWADEDMPVLAAAAPAVARQSFRRPADAGAAEAQRGGRARRRCPTSGTSRARRAPSACWRSPPPAATTC